MPRYSFNCEKCNSDFEEIVSYEQIDSVKCPQCSESAKRVFSFGGSKIERTKSEIMEQVKEDARKIVKKIKNGDQNAISEIYGGEK